MKPIVIYHDSCADGFAAAFAAWLKLGDDAEYFPCQYGKRAEEFDPAMCQDREVYILDFSFSKPTMESIFQQACEVVWLDHHKTAFEMWRGSYEKGELWESSGVFFYCLLDDNKSGAYLAWEYFHPDTEVPLFIKHIDDYDRWQFKIEGTKAFNKALWSYAPWSFTQWKDYFIWDTALTEDIENVREFVLEGAAILRAHEQNVASVVKGSARKCAISTCCPQHGPDIADSVPASWSDGYLRRFGGLAANCPPHLHSDVGHELAKQSGTFGLLWFIDKDNTCRCSLRSNGDYDVSAIAKAFGGGGHASASGFTVDIQTLLSWTK